MGGSALIRVATAALALSVSFSCTRFSITQAARVTRLDQISTLAARPVTTVLPLRFNDPLLAEQTYISHCRIDQAWRITRGDPGLRVAVVDGEIEPSLDLKGRILRESRWVREAPPTHATPIAGIIAALQDNGEGIAGITQCALISEVAQTPSSFPETATAEAIDDAVRHGARVINCSFGTPSRSKRLEEAVKRAIEKNVVIVASAMNEGSGVRYYPAAYEGVIAVASVDDQNHASVFSNYGPWLSIAAPGEYLLTTFPGAGLTSNYDYFSGTSASAAVVSGVVALMLSVNPNLTPAEVKAILEQTAQANGERRFNPLVGYGLIDAHRAVQVAQGLKRPQ